MSWLSGKTGKVVTLAWPTNDSLIEQASTNSISFDPPGTYSVLDDQVLRAFTVGGPKEHSTSIYLANLRQAISTGVSTAAFVKIITLPYAVHRASLLLGNAGFATLEFTQRTKSITLRIHNWHGAILKQITADAAAAYGDLVITEHAIAICISSGREPNPDYFLAGNPSPVIRVDNIPGPFPAEIRRLTGDQILVWNFETEVLNVVSIPQIETAPMVHEADFQLVCDTHLAIGGRIQRGFSRPSALLKSFAISDPEGTDRTFSHGENFEMGDDIGVVASPGSSAPNPILVNYHHHGGRFTVVKNELLTGEIHSEPRPLGFWDQDELHQFWDHPHVTRTIEGTISPRLPSISNSRVLVSLMIEDEDERFIKFSVKSPLGIQPYGIHGNILFLYDFDQKRCKDLLNLTEAERTSLENRLRKENKHAQVSIVERNFKAGIEEEIDTEYSLEFEPPQEYLNHLQGIRLVNESRTNGVEKTPTLEFDEAPMEKKSTPRILYTRSAVWFPENLATRGIEPRKLALTSSGIVYLPRISEIGFFLSFDEL